MSCRRYLLAVRGVVGVSEAVIIVFEGGKGEVALRVSALQPGAAAGIQTHSNGDSQSQQLNNT